MALREWVKWIRGILKEINDLASIDSEEPEEERKERKKRLEADPEGWFKYYFPQYNKARPAHFHLLATERVLKNKEWYEVRLWSRELAKSTRTMMEAFYLMLVGHMPGAAKNEEERLKKRYLLFVSNSLDNATRLLSPYKANLQCNKRIIQDYGMQKNFGNWKMSEFTTLDGIGFRALGVGQSPRGSRNEEVRPDIILFDDVDTDTDCLNPEITDKKWRWIEEAAIGTRSISEPTTIIFCGNRISADCCIQRATILADVCTELNIRDSNGCSIWPEKNTEASIDRVLSQKSYAAAQKEYFNNPITEGAVFKEMAYKPAQQMNDYETLVCYTDPSYKNTNDYKATVLVGKWKNEFHIIKCYLARATTAQMIVWHYDIMDLVGRNCCYYFMEQGFMQDVLVKEVGDAGKRTGRNIPIRGDDRKKPDKFMRIESLLEPLHRNGALYLNEAERYNPNMILLAEQFTAFAPGSRAHDDGPDALEGAIWRINDKLSRGGSGGIIPIDKQVNVKRY
jgi:predicted phage terminase large subunit-like protein